ncbi:hypothetical protein SprV_0802493400 [Sparganum proliferum]
MAAPQKGLLIVEPSSQLEFYGPFSNVQTSTIKLSNPTSDKVTFKVKTTVPKRYCVRPSCGIVEPQDSVDVLVSTAPNAEPTGDSRDKLVFMATIAPDDVRLDQVWQTVDRSKISEKLLMCTIKPRGSADQVSTSKGLEQEVIQLRKENAELRESHERLRRLGAENVSLVSPHGEGQGLMRMANIPPILYLLVTFLVALLVGKFVL